MIDFVPLFKYTSYFDFTILCLFIITIWQCHTANILKKEYTILNAQWGVLITILLILYMGLRPISSVFGDTVNYARAFQESQLIHSSFNWKWSEEWLFKNLLNWFAHYSNIHTFFLFCAFCYIFPLWFAMVRIFKTYYYIPFLVIIGMFTFWNYGVNGIRNGIGASIFILAMTYINKPLIMITLSILGCGFHKSIYLMLAASGLSYFLKNSYYYLIGWIACVGVSYVSGFQIQNILAKFGFGDDNRFTDYLTGDNMIGEIVQLDMVFRWDFLAYSTMGVAIGYYFIFRRNFKDEYYHWIYNTFLATNAFWVLVIRAAYSNRFAQISWFIMPIVLIYPFLKERFWMNHEKMLGYALILFYIFTFYYNIYRHI